MPCTIQVCTNSHRPAFCWKWTQRSVLWRLLLLLLLLLHWVLPLLHYTQHIEFCHCSTTLNTLNSATASRHSTHWVLPLLHDIQHIGALWRHSYQNSIRWLTVSFSDTFKRPINVPRHTSSSLAFAMNATDHINVVFRKFAYSLMRRVTASSNTIVTAIVNSDTYHQSPLIDKWESMLYV